MTKQRKNHSDEFKFKVALAALRGDRTVNQICQEYSVHPSLVQKWKDHLKKQGFSVFGKTTFSNTLSEIHEAEKAKLYQQIGQLSVERDFLKKALNK
jgi:transposase-like protein